MFLGATLPGIVSQVVQILGATLPGIVSQG